MRKIISTTLLLMVCLAAQSQSLMDLFKSSPSPSSSTSSNKSEEVIPFSTKALAGSWSYAKLTVDLREDSPLKGFAGDAAVGQVSKMLNGLAPNVGVTPGMFVITFIDANRLVFQIDGGRANGTYKSDAAKNSIVVNVGNVNNIEIGTLAAKVKIYKGSATLLFDAKDLIAIADKIPAVAEDSQYQMVKSVAGSLEGLLLGFSLDRK